MTAQRNKLLLIWLALAGLAVAIFFAEVKRSERISAPVVRESKRLLPAPIEDIRAVEIMSNGAMHRFERDSADLWLYHGAHDGTQSEHEHVTDPKLAALINEAMVIFDRVQREQSIPLPTGEDEFGVTRPDMFIVVYRSKTEEPLARYAVGTTATDGVSRYLLPVGAADIVTIPDFHIKNLLALIDAVKIAGAARP